MSILALAAAGIGSQPDITIDVWAGTYTQSVPGGSGLYSLTDAGAVSTGAGSPGNWIEPSGFAPGAYEVRATLNSGSLTGGTTGSWEALTTTRSWTCLNTGTANLTIEIRDGSAVVQSSGTVIINGGGPV